MECRDFLQVLPAPGIDLGVYEWSELLSFHCRPWARFHVIFQGAIND